MCLSTGQKQISQPLVEVLHVSQHGTVTDLSPPVEVLHLLIDRSRVTDLSEHATITVHY